MLRSRVPQGAVAAALAVLLGASFLLWMYSVGPLKPAIRGPAPVTASAWIGPGSPLVRVTPAPALDVLATLTVKGRAPKNTYDRTAFGQAWEDVDHNGCDTRNDVLRRDLKDLTMAAGSSCVVAAGLLKDPYTGQDIKFTRGADSSAAVQIDHVVALGDAWQKGAAQLNAQQRLSLANDPLNLIAVDGPTNVRKSDGDAATWLPPNKSYRCAYVVRQVSVKAAYELWVTDAELSAMQRILRDCPGENTLLSGYG